MSKPTLQVIVASTRPGRIGLPVGEWFRDVAAEHGAFAVELVDLAEVALPFFDEPKHPKLGDYVHQHTRDWSATITRGDAFVMVTPEYNHGFNAVLKNAIDFLSNEWAYKPVGFVSYGGVSAGTRAVHAIKPIASAVKLVPLFDTVAIPFVQQFLVDGAIVASEAMTRGAVTMLDELAKVTAMLRPRTA
ncbi:MAG: NAD(P)H-dependent oxidoreductase [Ilumatobacteraceae bacterium]